MFEIVNIKKLLLHINFYRMRGWRVVRAADSEGRVCDCLLLPMLANGIRYEEKYRHPNMFLVAFKKKRKKSGEDDETHLVCTYYTRDMIREMIETGVIGDNERPSRLVGNITVYTE